MAVMLIVKVPGSDRAQQMQILDALRERLMKQQGFLFHAGGPVEGGWRLHEVWETREQLQRWLDEVVFPALPPDAPEPELDIVPIDIVVQP